AAERPSTSAGLRAGSSAWSSHPSRVDSASMEWTVLGAGTIVPRVVHGCAGHALRPTPDARVTLFDCGPGTIRSLAASGMGVEDVERVCITHFHPDHCLDLFALAFARRNPALRSAGLPPLEIVGPIGITAILDRGEKLF